jgi:predicted nucleic acid-binding protein
MPPDRGRPALFDAVVISQFITGDAIELLAHTFERRWLLWQVRRELEAYHLDTSQILSLEAPGAFSFISLPEDLATSRKYLELRSTMHIGAGEAATLTYASFHDVIVVCNGQPALRSYCHARGIACLTTADILRHCHEQGLLTTEAGDAFVVRTHAQGGHPCCPSFTDLIAAP